MKRIAICINRRFGHNTSCAQRGSVALADAFEAAIAARGMQVRVMRLPCMGACEIGPNVKEVGGEIWHTVSEADIPRILDELALP